MKRIGVFVCWCGFNISGTIDVKAVASALADHPGVVVAKDYKYMCSEPGQAMIKEAIAEHRLSGVVVAACSPSMHETTFREAAQAAGLNPYMLEIANIREHASWVHPDDKIAATRKAIDLVKSLVEKVKRNEALEPIHVPMTKRALVIGGGIAGMQAALDLADGGTEVVLVERDSHIGGHMAQLSETFPTLDCASCILTPRTAEVGRHPLIKLHAYSEVAEVSGYVGNFTVKVRKKRTYVDWDKCIGCMDCMAKCPKKIPSQFERGLGIRKAIGVAFPQAIPYRPVIDRDACTYFKTGKCRICERVCSVGAIDFDQEERVIEEKVGAIIVATGYDLAPKAKFGEYGYGKIKDVVDGLEFERLNSSSGPTEGVIKRPSDGKIPREVVFIQCVGSRDVDKGNSYCSKICCMYTAKHAMLYKHKVPDGQAYVFYMDIRAGGKGYEEFVQRAVEQDGVLYLRGRVSKVYEDDGKVIVRGQDTLSGENIEIAADMVVLATAIEPQRDSRNLAQILKIGTDQYGFFNEAHPKLRPVESMTRGVFLAGCAQAPKDIPETVAQASGAASKVDVLFSKDDLVVEPLIASVDEAICSGCMWCEPICPYHAIEPKTIEERVGKKSVARRVASVNAGLCQGCGACSVACRDGAMNLKGYTNQQIMAEVEALCL
ncbi:MAG TPA: CoB--CoM heterodisulfide reductase iron-sulfur subunit A family protein [Clostridia bacterium]|nr:CoB--CoM heterodisulfide reductase iron-sulfur subunit A family protein [Clostridia bacterium]